jgi:hypothetical protein
MKASAWEALLRHIPSEMHQNLMLVTTSGTEVAIQTILRIDREFMAFKGRLAGSQEAGRLFFIPFTQIDYLGFQKTVKDTEYAQWFGGLIVPNATAESHPAHKATAAGAGVAEVSQRDPQAAANGSENPSTGSKTNNPVIKSAVLERFRSRGKSNPALRQSKPNPPQDKDPPPATSDAPNPQDG